MTSVDPKNLDDLRTKAKNLGREVVRTTVLEKEAAI